MSESGTADSGAPTWPADIIHVNEDGWVLVNRGRRHGLTVGTRLLVVGSGIREIRDLYAPANDGVAGEPALRVRRTYEQLEVVHVEERAAIAIATRTPAARRPMIYRGPNGELLVWVPLPDGFTWPIPGTARARDDEGSAPAEDEAVGAPSAEQEYERDGDEGQIAEEAVVTDEPPEIGEQDDERWEEALPLNGVNVGDLVVPAIPVATSIAGTAITNPSASAVLASDEQPYAGDVKSTEISAANPFESGRSYEWMQSNH